MTQITPMNIPIRFSSRELFSLNENYAKLFLLNKNYPEWRSECSLPPDLLLLSLSYLVEEQKEYRTTGELYKYGFLVNGKRQGVWTQLHDNGKIERTETYKTGLGHGEYKYYHYDGGQLAEHKFYENNTVHGESKQWYENGQLSSHGFYKNGRKEGEWKEWHQNGTVWRTTTFVNGKSNGERKEWYNDGKLATQCTYVNGKLHGEWTRWYNEGEVDSDPEADNKAESKAITNNPRMDFQCNYVDGVLHGEWKEWHDNGVLSFRTFYLQGRTVGEWTRFSRDGKVIESGYDSYL